MPRLLRSRAVPNPVAWNAYEQRKAIKRYTIPDDRARTAFRHVVAAVKSGAAPSHLVTGLLARTLQFVRNERYPYALISAKCANSLKRTLDLANAGAHRDRLEAGLMAATYDTWNLPKYFDKRWMLCIYGNLDGQNIMRDTRNLLVVREDAAKYAERRQRCLDRGDNVIMHF